MKRHGGPSHGVGSTLNESEGCVCIAALKDEVGREVHSEKTVEIHVRDGVPAKSGDQFDVGRKGKK